MKSVRPLKSYAGMRAGTRGAPTGNSILAPKHLPMLLWMLEFLAECPLHGSQACWTTSSIYFQLQQTLPYIKGNYYILVMSAH